MLLVIFFLLHLVDLPDQCFTFCPVLIFFYFQYLFLYISQGPVHSSGEQGMVDEAQKALEEAEALKKVFDSLDLVIAQPSPFYFP